MPISSQKLTKAMSETIAKKALDAKYGKPLTEAFAAAKKALLESAKANNKNPFKFTTAQVASGLVRCVDSVRCIMPDDDYMTAREFEPLDFRYNRSYVGDKYRGTLVADLKKAKILMPGKESIIMVSSPEIKKAVQRVHELLNAREVLYTELGVALRPGRAIGAIVKEFPFLAQFFQNQSTGTDNLKAAFAE